LLDEVIKELKQRGVSDGMLIRLADSSPLGRIFAAGLRNIKSTPEVMKESVEEAGRAVSHDLGRFLTSLGTIASISPLLGLFGTVVGMIEIFGSQSAVGNSPAILAHGISVALYNTAFGLIVAIPSMIFYRHFRSQVDSLTMEMEQQAIKLVAIVHSQRTI
jgi:biopolymer transport protein ExbB